MNRRMQLILISSATLIVAATLAVPAHAVITHRYSFTTNGNDSVGTADWTVNGGASFSDGQVHFNGVDSYLSLASTPLPTSGSMTMEIWGTYDPDTAVGSRIFDFSNAAGNTYMYLTPRATPGTPEGNPQDPALPGSNTRWRWNDNSNSYPDIGPMASAPSNTGQEVLFTLVYDATTPTALGAGEFRLYRDGSLVATDSGEGLPILGSPLSGTNMNRLGYGTSNPTGTTIRDLPAFLTGSLNELRIYNHVLSPVDVLTNLISGPDVTSVTFTNKTWNVAAGNWNADGSWSAPGVPNTTHRATISNNGVATVSGSVPQVGALTITNGTLSVGAGGSLDVKYPIEMNTGASNSATINVTDGGILAIGGILPEVSTGTKTINIDGGVIRPGFKSALVLAGATTNIGAGGATFDTPGSDSITWRSSLAGSGNLTKTGTGTLIVRPPAEDLGLADQNPDFSGEVFINGGTVDIQRQHGVFGTAGSTRGGKVHLNDSTLVINTAFPINFRKEVPTDLHVTGHSMIVNMVDRSGTEIRLQGSLTGDGTIEFVKPALADALGLDFENRPNPDVANEPDAPLLPIDNSGFTGRVIVNGNWAVRFRGGINDPDATPDTGDETPYFNVDLPNAIFEMSNAGAWAGKRGSDPNQTIRLGGVEGVAGSRLQAAIAGDGDALADVTYQLGGASQNAVFFGNVIDGNATDTVTVTKVGNNIQSFNGANTYSGTTTINSGTLRVNGTHTMDETLLIPVGDYTVNAGGTLGGIGTIGSASDPVNIINNGGTIAPGESVGTLSVHGNVTFGTGAGLNIEVDGANADRLAVTGNIDLSALGNVLNVTGNGSGSWVIATYTGTLTGTFESVTSGISVTYGSGQIMISGTLSAAGLPGDYNNDGKVDAADYTVWRNHLGESDETNINNNGDGGGITGADYTWWKQHYGTMAPGSAGLSSMVPEPASVALVALAATIVGLVRRRRYN